LHNIPGILSSKPSLKLLFTVMCTVVSKPGHFASADEPAVATGTAGLEEGRVWRLRRSW